jgi:hypothetical protein
MSGWRFGFRRRCAWCGVALRGWQLNLCRTCKTAVLALPVAGMLDSPPCPHASRWDDEPDTWRRELKVLWVDAPEENR